MVVSLKANRKRIIAFLILVAAVVGACIFLRGGEQEPPKEYPGGTNEERLSFLEGFGWQVAAEPAETREVMIPAEFNDVYTTYNVMQKAQGFDLKPYAGEVCTQYKYKIENYDGESEVYATLLVYGNLIIGGDLACAEVDGFMHGFAKDSARYGETNQKEESQAESAASTVSAPESSQTESTMTNSSAAQSVSSAAEGNAETTSAVVPQMESGVESTAGEAISEGAFPTD